VDAFFDGMQYRLFCLRREADGAEADSRCSKPHLKINMALQDHLVTSKCFAAAV
jgi:hypothetical protein